MTLKISLWQKYWPWSSVRKAQVQVDKFRRERNWDAITGYYVVARDTGDIRQAAYTPEVINNLVSYLLTQEDLHSGRYFLQTMLNDPDQTFSYQKSLIAACQESISDTVYENVTDILDVLATMPAATLSGPVSAIVGDVTEALLQDSLERVLYDHNPDCADRLAIWKKLYAISPKKVADILISQLDTKDDDFDIDRATNVMGVANDADILNAIPADCVQGLLDYSIEKGLPESTTSVYWFVKNGKQKHLRNVHHDKEKFALVPFEINRDDKLILLFRLRATHPDDAVVVENNGEGNISAVDMLHRIATDSFYYSQELDETSDDTINSLAALFDQMSKQNKPTSVAARKILAEIEIWFKAANRTWPPATVRRMALET